MPLDIKDFDAIDRLGAAIFERWKKLDILIGNAGVLGKLTPMPHVDQKMWDEVMAVNVTANYRLIRSHGPAAAPVGCGPRGVRDLGPCQQVLGLLGPLLDFQGGARGDGEDLCRGDRAPPACRANCFSPGATRTGMRAKAMPGEDPMSLPHPDDVAAQIMPMCEPAFTDNGGVWKYDRQGPVQAVLTS